jgi:hypothetical protein
MLRGNTGAGGDVVLEELAQNWRYLEATALDTISHREGPLGNDRRQLRR